MPSLVGSEMCIRDSRHTGEIEQELSQTAGKKIKVSMSPHAVDVVRGILCTNHTFLKKDVDEKELWKIYRSEYSEERFIRLIRDKEGLHKFPDPKFLVGSNFCDIGSVSYTHLTLPTSDLV